MIRRSELVQVLTRQINSQSASSLFLNGAPGSGKSFLLGQLAKELPAQLRRSLVLGPFSVPASGAVDLGPRIAKELHESGFTTHLPEQDHLDLLGTWNWLADAGEIARGQSIFVLVDLADDFEGHEAWLGTLFSSARHVEGMWHHADLHLNHLFAGTWDHVQLEKHFENIHTSFPYTVGHNYAIWTGVTSEDMVALVARRLRVKRPELLGRLLYELTGGHPGAADDILERFEASDLTLMSLLHAAGQTALSGPTAEALIRSWSRFPPQGKALLGRLLVGPVDGAGVPEDIVERVLPAGAVHSHSVEGTGYLTFRSWFAEVLVRLHSGELGIAEKNPGEVRLDDLMPRISEVNLEAFRIINSIENMTRNTVVAYLSAKKNGGEHMLSGKALKYNQDTGGLEDAYQRALSFQTRSENRGLCTKLNPLIAYSSTRDLATLIQEIAGKEQSTIWRRIGNAIQDVSDIRDAVMHNQLVEFADLDRLYLLQADLYAAFGTRR